MLSVGANSESSTRMSVGVSDRKASLTDAGKQLQTCCLEDRFASCARLHVSSSEPLRAARG